MGRAFNVSADSLEGTIYDESNPTALINLVPDRVVPVLQRIKPKLPRVLFCTEAELREYVKPDERDERVRLSFWDEYNHSTRVGKKMSLSAFLHGVMSWEAWVNVFEPSDKRMMWVFCPPVSYQVAMRNILHKGTERLMEIMSLPIIDKDGKPDSKVIVNILKAFQLVDMRVKGAITQKLQIQQQSVSLNQNIHHTHPTLADGRPIEAMQLEDLERLDKKLERARRDSRRLLSEVPPEERERYLADMSDGSLAIGGELQTIRKLEIEDLDAALALTVEPKDSGEE